VDVSKKEEKKGTDEEIHDADEERPLDGKGLHDLYRHTTKLIK